MNNITETKLKNFPEIQCYIIVSCHTNTIIDQKQYYMLIMSPYEIELAFKSESFPSFIITDNRNLSLQNETSEKSGKNEPDMKQSEDKPKLDSLPMI